MQRSVLGLVIGDRGSKITGGVVTNHPIVAVADGGQSYCRVPSQFSAAVEGSFAWAAELLQRGYGLCAVADGHRVEFLPSPISKRPLRVRFNSGGLVAVSWTSLRDVRQMIHADRPTVRVTEPSLQRRWRAVWTATHRAPGATTQTPPWYLTRQSDAGIAREIQGLINEVTQLEHALTNAQFQRRPLDRQRIADIATVASAHLREIRETVGIDERGQAHKRVKNVEWRPASSG